MKKCIAWVLICALVFLNGCNSQSIEMQSKTAATANAANAGENSIQLQNNESVLLEELSAEKSLQLSISDKVNVNARPMPKNAVYKGMISYETSNQDVATVDANGQVTAVSSGEAVITSKVDGKSVQTQIIVLPQMPTSQETENQQELQDDKTQNNIKPNATQNNNNNSGSTDVPENNVVQPQPTQAPQPTPPRRHHQNGSDCTTWLFSHVSQEPTCRVPGTEVYYCKDVEICGLASIRIGSIAVVPCDFSLVDYATQKPVCRWCGQLNDENWKVPEELPGDYPNGLL